MDSIGFPSHHWTLLSHWRHHRTPYCLCATARHQDDGTLVLRGFPTVLALIGNHCATLHGIHQFFGAQISPRIFGFVLIPSHAPWADSFGLCSVTRPHTNQAGTPCFPQHLMG